MESKHKGIHVRALLVPCDEDGKIARVSAFHWVRGKSAIKYIFVYAGLSSKQGNRDPIGKLPSKKFEPLLRDSMQQVSGPRFYVEDILEFFPHAMILSVSTQHEMVQQFVDAYSKSSLVLCPIHAMHKQETTRPRKVESDEEVIACLLKGKMPKKMTKVLTSPALQGFLGLTQGLYGKVVEYYDSLDTGSFSRYSTVEGDAPSGPYVSYFSIVFAKEPAIQDMVARLDMMMALALIMDNCSCTTNGKSALQRLPVWSVFAKHAADPFRNVFATVDQDVYEHTVQAGETIGQAVTQVLGKCPANTLERMQNAYTRSGVTRVGLEFLYKDSWQPVEKTPTKAKDVGFYDGTNYYLPSRVASGYATPSQSHATHLFKTQYFMWNGKGRALEVSGPILVQGNAK